MTGAIVMAKKQEDADGGEQGSPGRLTIINLKGSHDQVDWLGKVSKKTHISKSMIVRLALSEWAAKHGHQDFPMGDDE